MHATYISVRREQVVVYCTEAAVSAEYLAIAIEERWRYRTFQCIFVSESFPLHKVRKYHPRDLGKAGERVHFSMPELA